MHSKHNPADSLADVVENAGRITGYIAGMDRSGFEQSGVVRDAVERCLERICEAVHRLGGGAEALLPNQPVRQIRNMGNRLRHAYDRISLEVVWSSARDDVPELEAAARQALAKLEAGNDPIA